MRTIFLSSTILLVVLFSTMGCQTHKKTTDGKEEEGETTWMAVSLYQNSISEVDFMRGSPSIIFKNSTSISGSTGCNQFSAKYNDSADGVKISMGPMTKMACPGSEEETFIKALTETNRVEKGKEEVIFYKDENELIKFKIMR